MNKDGKQGSLPLPTIRRYPAYLRLIRERMAAGDEEISSAALVAAGVKGIWNFTSVQLSVPDDVIVQSVDLAQSLAVLSHKIANMQQSTRPFPM